MSEKVGGAEGTKLDDDFKEMERVSLHRAPFDVKLSSILRGEGETAPRWYLKMHFVILKGTLLLLSILKQKMQNILFSLCTTL